MSQEWIKLYDTDTGETESSWVRSVGWNEGDLIVRRYDDNPENPETILYDDLEYEVFEDIKEVYNKGGSVGSFLNEEVIRNKDVDKGQKLQS